MDIIIIEHADFLLEISQEYMDAERIFSEIFTRAKHRNTEKYFDTYYSFTDKSLLVEFSIIDPRTETLKKRTIESVKYPVFYENMVYMVSIEFLGDISDPKIYSRNKQIARAFKAKETRFGTPLLFGYLSFNNTVGKFELNINYNRGTDPKTVILGFEVFSSMLALKRDVPLMISDIEKLFPRMVFDYVKITDHPFYNAAGDFNELMWWIIFDNIYKSILENLQFIFDRPYTSYEEMDSYKKDEQIDIHTLLVQRKISRFAGSPNKFFVMPGLGAMQDNYENRVVKFIVRDIVDKFQRVYTLVKDSESGKRMTNEYKAQLEFAEKALQWLVVHPVFQLIGEIDEVNEIPHVMTLKTGYGGLINDWNKLNEGYGLFDGLNSLELKDNAYIYKLWCFMNIAKLIESLGGKLTEIVKVPEIIPDQFVFLPDKEMNARLIFKFANGDILELYMELLYNDKFDKSNVGTFRGTVRPDIVLRVRKSDLPGNMYLTYLFDANYRAVESDNDQLPDLPHPVDQARMHYYRDTIHSREKKKNRLSKEVMGIAVLYPAQGTLRQFENLMRKTAPTDAGGIAFNPGQPSTNSLISNYISYIINTEAAKLLKDAYPYKGREYKKDEVFVFIPFIRKEEIALISYLKNTADPLLVYEAFLPALGDGSLRYCTPYIENEGILFVWEIAGHDWKSRKEVYPPDHELFRQDIADCLVLKLSDKEKLKAPLKVKGVIKTIRYTKMKYINHPVNGFIKTISERETLGRNT